MSLVSGKYHLFVREESRKSKEKCHPKANDSNIHRLLLLERNLAIFANLYLCVPKCGHTPSRVNYLTGDCVHGYDYAWQSTQINYT